MPRDGRVLPTASEEPQGRSTAPAPVEERGHSEAVHGHDGRVLRVPARVEHLPPPFGVAKRDGQLVPTRLLGQRRQTELRAVLQPVCVGVGDAEPRRQGCPGLVKRWGADGSDRRPAAAKAGRGRADEAAPAAASAPRNTGPASGAAAASAGDTTNRRLPSTAPTARTTQGTARGSGDPPTSNSAPAATETPQSPAWPPSAPRGATHSAAAPRATREAPRASKRLPTVPPTSARPAAAAATAQGTGGASAAAAIMAAHHSASPTATPTRWSPVACC